jgi:choline dehydrogenase
MPDSAADYVVIGAGTAGCIVASRLSVHTATSVALLEFGGPDNSPAIYDPLLTALFALWDVTVPENWGYITDPQPNLNGRTVEIARGRVLGGSSAVNAMIYIRGHPRDFDAWRDAGNPGWEYASVLPYFRKSETYHGAWSPFHGDDGPISVIDYPSPSPVSHAFVGAAAELGAKGKHNDFNGADQGAGAGFYQSTRTPAGRRVTSASAFITPFTSERPNLRVSTGVRVTRLRVENHRVNAVEYEGPEGTGAITVQRDAIVCAGAFESPKLLMLSGIGPANTLRGHGIPVVQDLPEVGKNLQDHMLLGIAYDCPVELPPPSLLAEGGLFLRTPDETGGWPNLQYFFGPVKFVPPGYSTRGPGFTLAAILSRPKSRGKVTLCSANPRDLACVDPNYLAEEADLAVLEHGIRFARDLVATVPFGEFRGPEIAPRAEVQSSPDLRAYIRAGATTVWHPCGTCRMGSDPGSVVDTELKVRGLDNLRVVDASVMPTLVNGNPNAAVMMIAEKAADLIRASQMPTAGASVSPSQPTMQVQP